jgi:dTDP-4-amino-4,6-dideoxygalactose transaminase
LITHFPTYRGLPSVKPAGLPVAEKIADQVICLPIYPELVEPDVQRIASLIASND